MVAVTAAASYQFRLLTASGAIAAFFSGVSIFLGFGARGLVLLGVFFLTSSLLSIFKHQRKMLLGDLHEKGSTRDWAQVAANGGTAAIAGIVNHLYPDPVWVLAFSISLASANADTWASELGILSKNPPYSVKTFKMVPRGTSGAVSLFGTFAAGAGSLLIAAAALLLFELELLVAATVFFVGMAGMMIDALLGASVQALYECPGCRAKTEKKIHCGKSTMLSSGYRVMNNDVVNFSACFISALMGISFYKVFF